MTVNGGDASIGALAVFDCKHRRKASNMVFVWSNVWPKQTSSTRGPSAASNFTIVFPATTSSILMARIDDTHANAPAVWRSDGRPLYLRPDDVKRYVEASRVSWNPVTMRACSNSCTLGPFSLPHQGLAIFSYNAV